MKKLFLALVIVQALHMIEEYAFELWSVFPPARYVLGLISQNLEAGFLVVNISFVLFGLACYWWPVHRGWPSAVGLAWFWGVLETVNGIGHIVWAAAQQGYRPGVATAPFLLVLALLLIRELIRSRNQSASPHPSSRA